MSKGLKLYVLAYRTVVCVNKIESIKDILPTRQQIVDHVMNQQKEGGKNFKLYEIEIDSIKMKEICLEVKKLSRVNVNDLILLISLGDTNHPIISIVNKEAKEKVLKAKEAEKQLKEKSETSL